MKINKLYSLIFFSFVLLVIPIVFAAPPFTVAASQGVTIVPPEYEGNVIGSDFNFDFHAINTSNGLPLDNSSIRCLFHLYDSKGGHAFLLEPVPYNYTNAGFDAHVDAGNFTKEQRMSFYIRCNNTALGGVFASPFIVNAAGKDRLDVLSIVVILLYLLGIYLTFYTLFLTLSHFEDLNIPVMDVMLSIVVYIGMLVIRNVNSYASGFSIIENTISPFIYWGAFTQITLPIIVFVLSITLGKMNRERTKNDR